jgi:hypothetical protein
MRALVAGVAVALVAGGVPAAGMDIVPSRSHASISLSLASAQAGVGTTVAGTVSGTVPGRAELDVFVHAGAGGCAATAAGENARVSAHADAQDEEPISMLLDRAGAFREQFFVRPATAAILHVCAYLVPASGSAAVKPLSATGVTLHVAPAPAPARGSAVLPLVEPRQLVVFDGAGIACYAFPSVHRSDGKKWAAAGLGCFPAGATPPLEVYLAAAGLVVTKPQTVLVTSIDYVSDGLRLAGTPRTTIRHLPGKAGSAFRLDGTPFVCLFGRSTSLDAGHDGVACVVTAHGGRVVRGQITDILASRPHVAVSAAEHFASSSVVEGVSGFFVDDRVVGAISIRSGHVELVAQKPVCAEFEQQHRACPR